MELGTFKRLDENRIVVDGIVWTIDTEKAIEIINPATGNKMHSIVLDEVHYYPSAIYKSKKSK